MEINHFLCSSSIRKQAFKRYLYKSKSVEQYTNKLKGYNIGIGDWIQAPNTCISAKERGPKPKAHESLKRKESRCSLHRRIQNFDQLFSLFSTFNKIRPC